MAEADVQTAPDVTKSDAVPRIAIVTVAYNNLEGLKATVETILAQTSRDFDWAIVDGGSTDGSKEYLESLDVPQLTWCSERDGGLYNAMNKGVDMTRGTYIIFMNSGDRFADPGEVAAAVADVVEEPDMLYGDSYEFDEEGDYFKRANGHRLYWYSMFTHHQAIYYHRRLFADQRYDESFVFAGDWAFTALAVKASKSFKYVRRPVCKFGRDGGSFLGKRAARDAEMMRVYREFIRLPRPLLWIIPRVKTGVNAVRFKIPWLYDTLRLRRAK